MCRRCSQIAAIASMLEKQCKKKSLPVPKASRTKLQSTLPVSLRN